MAGSGQPPASVELSTSASNHPSFSPPSIPSIHALIYLSILLSFLLFIHCSVRPWMKAQNYMLLWHLVKLGEKKLKDWHGRMTSQPWADALTHGSSLPLPAAAIYLPGFPAVWIPSFANWESCVPACYSLKKDSKPKLWLFFSKHLEV